MAPVSGKRTDVSIGNSPCALGKAGKAALLMVEVLESSIQRFGSELR